MFRTWRSILLVLMLASLHGSVVAFLASAGGADQSSSMIEVLGRPAIAYGRPVGDLRFAIATSPFGVDFGDFDVLVDNGVSTLAVIDTALVNGHPAIAYVEGSAVRFIRASTPDGSTWPLDGGTLVTQDPDNPTAVFGECLSLAVIDGIPAITFSKRVFGFRTLHYIRSLNVFGSSWVSGTVRNVSLDAGSGKWCSMVELPGSIPGIAFTTSDILTPLQYTAGLDADGTTFGAVEVLSADVDAASDLTLVGTTPIPAISWVKGDQLRYAYPSVGSWVNTLVYEDATSNLLPQCALVDQGAGNGPAILFGSNLGQLLYTKSDSEYGTSWAYGTVFLTASFDNVGPYSLEMVGGVPAVSYHDATSFDVFYDQVLSVVDGGGSSSVTISRAGLAGQNILQVNIGGNIIRYSPFPHEPVHVRDAADVTIIELDTGIVGGLVLESVGDTQLGGSYSFDGDVLCTVNGDLVCTLLDIAVTDGSIELYAEHILAEGFDLSVTGATSPHEISLVATGSIVGTLPAVDLLNGNITAGSNVNMTVIGSLVDSGLTVSNVAATRLEGFTIHAMGSVRVEGYHGSLAGDDCPALLLKDDVFEVTSSVTAIGRGTNGLRAYGIDIDNVIVRGGDILIDGYSEGDEAVGVHMREASLDAAVGDVIVDGFGQGRLSPGGEAFRSIGVVFEGVQQNLTAASGSVLVTGESHSLSMGSGIKMVSAPSQRFWQASAVAKLEGRATTMNGSSASLFGLDIFQSMLSSPFQISGTGSTRVELVGVASELSMSGGTGDSMYGMRFSRLLFSDWPMVQSLLVNGTVRATSPRPVSFRNGYFDIQCQYALEEVDVTIEGRIPTAVDAFNNGVLSASPIVAKSVTIIGEVVSASPDGGTGVSVSGDIHGEEFVSIVGRDQKSPLSLQGDVTSDGLINIEGVLNEPADASRPFARSIVDMDAASTIAAGGRVRICYETNEVGAYDASRHIELSYYQITAGTTIYIGPCTSDSELAEEAGGVLINTVLLDAGSTITIQGRAYSQLSGTCGIAGVEFRDSTIMSATATSIGGSVGTCHEMMGVLFVGTFNSLSSGDEISIVGNGHCHGVIIFADLTVAAEEVSIEGIGIGCLGSDGGALHVSAAIVMMGNDLLLTGRAGVIGQQHGVVLEIPVTLLGANIHIVGSVVAEPGAAFYATDASFSGDVGDVLIEVSAVEGVDTFAWLVPSNMEVGTAMNGSPTSFNIFATGENTLIWVDGDVSLWAANGVTVTGHVTCDAFTILDGDFIATLHGIEASVSTNLHVGSINELYLTGSWNVSGPIQSDAALSSVSGSFIGESVSFAEDLEISGDTSLEVNVMVSAVGGTTSSSKKRSESSTRDVESAGPLLSIHCTNVVPCVVEIGQGDAFDGSVLVMGSIVVVDSSFSASTLTVLDGAIIGSGDVLVDNVVLVGSYIAPALRVGVGFDDIGCLAFSGSVAGDPSGWVEIQVGGGYGVPCADGDLVSVAEGISGLVLHISTVGAEEATLEVPLAIVALGNGVGVDVPIVDVEHNGFFTEWIVVDGATQLLVSFSPIDIPVGMEEEEGNGGASAVEGEMEVGEGEEGEGEGSGEGEGEGESGEGEQHGVGEGEHGAGPAMHHDDLFYEEDVEHPNIGMGFHDGEGDEDSSAAGTHEPHSIFLDGSMILFENAESEHATHLNGIARPVVIAVHPATREDDVADAPEEISFVYGIGPELYVGLSEGSEFLEEAPIEEAVLHIIPLSLVDTGSGDVIHFPTTRGDYDVAQSTGVGPGLSTAFRFGTDGGGEVIYVSTIFQDDTLVSYGTATLQVPSGSVKSTLFIRSADVDSDAGELEFEVAFETADFATVVQERHGDRRKEYRVSDGHGVVTIVGLFTYAILDGVERDISVRVEVNRAYPGDNYVIFTFPPFEDTLFYDPDFSVLLNGGGGGSSYGVDSVIAWLSLGVFCGIVVLAVVVAAIGSLPSVRRMMKETGSVGELRTLRKQRQLAAMDGTSDSNLEDV